MSTPHRIRSRWAIIRQFFDSGKLEEIARADRFEMLAALKDDLARRIDEALDAEQHLENPPALHAMDKMEILCRAWIDCDPNRSAGAEPGSGFHPDDPMPARRNTVHKTKSGEIIGLGMEGVSEELQGEPYWRWFLPRAVALEQYLEQHGFVIVKLEQTAAAGKEE